MVVVISRFKRCRICFVVKKRRVIFRKYKCVRNWIGLVKLMEVDMVVDMLKIVKEKDVIVVMLIGDDDIIGF